MVAARLASTRRSHGDSASRCILRFSTLRRPGLNGVDVEPDAVAAFPPADPTASTARAACAACAAPAAFPATAAPGVAVDRALEGASVCDGLMDADDEVGGVTVDWDVAGVGGVALVTVDWDVAGVGGVALVTVLMANGCEWADWTTSHRQTSVSKDPRW